MNQLLDNLVDSKTGYSPEIFHRDFSEYFLPNDPETQANLRISAKSALEWMEVIENGTYFGLEHSIMRHKQLRSQAEAIGMMVLRALIDSTAHGEDHE